jgi:cytochrome oxidase assembly protein ShyY1
MARQNQSYVEGLAQITTEEGQLAYGIQRYFLGVIAALLWTFLIVYLTTDFEMPFKDRGVKHPAALAVFSFLAVAFSFGSWWANRIHLKITELRDSIEPNE